MAQLSRDEVEHIAALARLHLTEEEKNVFGTQLSSILDYVAKLQTVDTSAVKPLDHVLDVKNVTRNDEVKPYGATSRTLIIENFPGQTGDLLSVPAVFEQTTENF